MIKLQHPKYLHKVGKRANNEDAFYFEENLFVVCDGVGGSNKGEVASHLASEKFSEFLKNNAMLPHNANFWERASQFIEKAFDEKISQTPECKGMGTTLVALLKNNDKLTVVWAGDSPLYQFRDGQIIFKTKDHSLVQKMVDEGDITAEEAENHPQKNIILRAINGSHNPTKFDFATIEDVKENDIFLLCTDGITDGLSSEKLIQIIDFADGDIEFLTEQLDAYCTQHSKDNYTCIATKITQITENEPLIADKAKVNPIMKYLPYGLIALSILVFSILGFQLGRNKAKKSKVQTSFQAAKAFYNDSLYQSALEELNTIDSTYRNQEITDFKLEVENKLREIQLKEMASLRLSDELKTIDNLIDKKIAQDTTLNKTDYQPLKEFVKGKHYYQQRDFNKAFLFLSGIEGQPVIDTFILEPDWQMLIQLYKANLESDSTYLQNIAFCAQRLKETKGK